MKLLKSKKRVNYWISKNQIPLGLTKNKEIIWKRFTFKSDSLIFSARPGIGKSVMLKSFYFWLFQNQRPLIVFDPEGLDHRLSYFPNSHALKLPPDTKPWGIKKLDSGQRAYYFTISKNPMPHERKFIPALSTFGVKELRSLGFSPGAIRKFLNLLEEYGPFKDFETLMDFIHKFPIREDIAEKYQRNMPFILHNKNYLPNDVILSSTKNNMVQHLYSIMQEGIFSLNPEDNVSFIDLIKKGHSVFLSFDGHYDVCRAMVGKIAGEVISYLKYLEDIGERDTFGQPWFIFEEMDGIIPRNPEPYEEPIVETLAQLILRFRKLSVGMAGACPSLTSLNKKVTQGFHEYIFGRFAGTELTEIASITQENSIISLVNNLYWNRHVNGGAGEREVLYVTELKQKYKIDPFECPCEIHREPTKVRKHESSDIL